MSTSKEVAALLSLVDDPDVDVYHAVKDRILNLGRSMIPRLEHLSEVHPQPHVQHRVESIIHSFGKTVKNNATRLQLEIWWHAGGGNMNDFRISFWESVFWVGLRSHLRSSV